MAFRFERERDEFKGFLRSNNAARRGLTAWNWLSRRCDKSIEAMTQDTQSTDETKLMRFCGHQAMAGCSAAVTGQGWVWAGSGQQANSSDKTFWRGLAGIFPALSGHRKRRIWTNSMNCAFISRTAKCPKEASLQRLTS